MKTLKTETADRIKWELENLPKKYQDKNFGSTHEGYAVILEEVRELEQEVFFGAKKALKEVEHDLNQTYRIEEADRRHRQRMKEECIQIAAMCARFIQELT